jgi:hypothetical protein
VDDESSPATISQIIAAGFDPTDTPTGVSYVVDSSGNVTPQVAVSGSPAQTPAWPLLIVLGVIALTVYYAGTQHGR